ncbi:MAG: LPS assembly lipoprotein LptE [Candidatus Binatia bacterium]
MSDQRSAISDQQSVLTQRSGVWSFGQSAIRNPQSAIQELRIVSFLLLSCLIPACGYHFSGVRALPQGIQSVSFAEFTNDTPVVGVEKELQWALEREFRNRGGITVTEGGEGIINVTLQQFDLDPLSFDRRDQVLQYQVILEFDISLTHRDTGQVVWQAGKVRVAEDYSAIPQVVVSTSPEFLQGPLNPEDLPGFTDIQFSETQRRLAIARLLTAAAREAYFRLGENF